MKRQKQMRIIHTTIIPSQGLPISSTNIPSHTMRSKFSSSKPATLCRNLISQITPKNFIRNDQQFTCYLATLSENENISIRNAYYR